jgi:hypothetical protein
MESFFHSLKAVCGNTTISACIPHWTINRPLTMSAQPRRTFGVYGIEGRSARRGN